ILAEDTEIVAIVFNEAIIRNSGLDNTEHLYFTPYLTSQLKLPNFLKESKYLEAVQESMFKIINEYRQKEKGFELMIKSEIFKIFGLSYSNFYKTDYQINVSIRRNYKLSPFLNYLRKNYDQDISLKTAAKMVNLTANHLCKVFKKVTGKTLIEYTHHLW